MCKHLNSDPVFIVLVRIVGLMSCFGGLELFAKCSDVCDSFELRRESSRLIAAVIGRFDLFS